MRTTISSFAAIVQRDYGEPVARDFSQRYTNANEEISFGDAMNVLDSVLDRAPAPPALRTVATSSVPGKVILKMRK